ncbi:response regulator [Bacteroides sp. 51]|uniref:response regulator n=1 Tax=Bacteroides sp. 51 TaxID=2302938 RepID=UPI0013D49DCB|nr:response regulator [Bacteroides sp. 51]NDV82540.1 response regulator [Bacteroides sp. 51]
MAKLDVNIIIIDDDRKFEDDPFVEELKEIYEDVIFFNNSQDGLDYIEKQIDQEMIVVLDLGFAYNMPDGHEVLRRIREMTSLIPVIIWSGKDEDKEVFADLIENRAFAFIKKSASTEELLDIIKKAYDYMQSNISNVIEEWIKGHPEEAKEQRFLTSTDGKDYTLNDVLKEIRLQTEFGLGIEKSINKLTIDLLMRNKEKLQ